MTNGQLYNWLLVISRLCSLTRWIAIGIGIGIGIGIEEVWEMRRQCGRLTGKAHSEHWKLRRDREDIEDPGQDEAWQVTIRSPPSDLLEYSIRLFWYSVSANKPHWELEPKSVLKRLSAWLLAQKCGLRFILLVTGTERFPPRFSYYGSQPCWRRR